MVFAPLMLKEPLRARDLWMLAVCALGMTLFFFDELSPGQRNGNLIALVSGVGFGFVILGMRWGRARTPDPAPPGKAGPEGVEAAPDAASARGGIGKVPDSSNAGPNEAEQLAIWGNLFCFLLCVPVLKMPPATAEYAGPLALIAAMGVFQLGLGYLLLARGIKHVPAMEASLLVLIEPVLNPVWTLLAAGERPSAWALAGGSVIIGTVAFQALRGRS
ncbi:MAG: DMT family transporter [Planctomycetes bacterium]|nr:DMT family transporter [Planctomycetota bacterium]